MCSRRGVPDPVKAAQIIEWDCWKTDGKFSFELLRIFSSLMSGRGLLLKKESVEQILAWPCWQVKGEFSPDLLRTIAIMMRGRGMFDKAQVEEILSWSCWKIDGKFNLECCASSHQ